MSNENPFEGVPIIYSYSRAQAIEDGVDPREVWRALCADFDVPRDQW